MCKMHISDASVTSHAFLNRITTSLSTRAQAKFSRQKQNIHAFGLK